MEEKQIGRITVAVVPEMVGINEAMKDADELVSKLNEAIALMERIGKASIEIHLHPEELQR